MAAIATSSSRVEEMQKGARLLHAATSGDIAGLRSLQSPDDYDKLYPFPAGSEHKESVLMRAAGAGQLSMVRYLQQVGADLQLENEQRQTALSLAVENGQLEVAQWLLANGSRATLSALASSVKGRRSASRAAPSRSPLFLAAARADVPMMRLLLAPAAGAQAAFVEEDGSTALHAAVLACIRLRGDEAALDAVELLCADPRVNVLASDDKMATPVTLAAASGCAPILRRLFAAKALVSDASGARLAEALRLALIACAAPGAVVGATLPPAGEAGRTTASLLMWGASRDTRDDAGISVLELAAAADGSEEVFFELDKASGNSSQHHTTAYDGGSGGGGGGSTISSYDGGRSGDRPCCGEAEGGGACVIA